MFYKYRGEELNKMEKEAIWESFKTVNFIDDNPDDIDERLVSL